jgi:hypothetical protein
VRSAWRRVPIPAFGMLLGLLACDDPRPHTGSLPGAFREHYLIDYENTDDSTTLSSTIGHLVVFNPGPRDAELIATLYFENAEPTRFALVAPAGRSTESNSHAWPIRGGGRFALRIESTQPVVCQATIGWTNTAGRYEWGARAGSPSGPREAAKSYNSIPGLSRGWVYADGIVIRDVDDGVIASHGDSIHRSWIRESEWAVLLNPGDAPATAVMTLHYAPGQRRRVIALPPRRVVRVLMDSVAPPNSHYGVTVRSDRKIAMQWLREVNWQSSADPMAFWSVPAVPLGDAR